MFSSIKVICILIKCPLTKLDVEIALDCPCSFDFQEWIFLMKIESSTITQLDKVICKLDKECWRTHNSCNFEWFLSKKVQSIWELVKVMFERSNTTTLIGIVVPLKIVDISIFVNPLLLRFLPNTQKHRLVWSFQYHFFFNSNMLAKLHILSMTLVLYWSWGMYNKEAKSIISSQHMCNHYDSYI